MNEAPARKIAGKKTLLNTPAAMALDAAGDIYVANQKGGPPGAGKHYAPGTITVYPSGSSGDVAPSARIRGDATGLTFPEAIVVDEQGKIDVGNGQYSIRSNKTYPASVEVLAAGSTGDIAPLTTISGTATELTLPALAVWTRVETPTHRPTFILLASGSASSPQGPPAMLRRPRPSRAAQPDWVFQPG